MRDETTPVDDLEAATDYLEGLLSGLWHHRHRAGRSTNDNTKRCVCCR